MPSSPHPHDARLLHLLRCLPFLHTAQGVERSCEDQIAVGYLLIQTPRLVLWPSGSSGSAARSTSTRFFVYRILSVSARRRLCSAVLAARRFAPAGRAMAYAVTPGWPTAPLFHVAANICGGSLPWAALEGGPKPSRHVWFSCP